MLKTKTFLTKTKKGNILKIVREHYLRDDIWCGSQFCVICPHKSRDLVLEEIPESKSSIFPFPHYLILDTNVVLHQMDVLEVDALYNIIITQTVLEEVRHRSCTLHARLRNLMSNRDRNFYTFVNEHHQQTYVGERQRGESANDRNDRAIRKVVSWYESHLKRSQESREEKDRVRMVLITDDIGSLEKAKEDGILVSTMAAYIRSLTGFPGLEDRLTLKVSDEWEERRRNDPKEKDQSSALYPLHLTPTQVREGVKSGRLLQGTFLASRENFLEGNVNVEGKDYMVLVQGRCGLNRAVDGDSVAVELLPEEEWSSPCEVVLQDEAGDEGDMVEEDKEIKLVSAGSSEKSKDGAKKQAKERIPTGKVVAIIRRKWRQYCGILQVTPGKSSTRHLFVPAERKIPKVRIETRQADVLASQRIIVAIDSWPRHSRYPQGHFVRALGPIGDRETENEVLLLEHDVPHSAFSEAVLADLPMLPWIITPEDEAVRTDLRHLDICSVDPPGCTDIDDALHCRYIDKHDDQGGQLLEVGVHIADVSHFIRPGTAIDREAALRATTVYLVDNRIDMVPELLSSNLCSLRGGEERFAFSCIWEMTEDANIVNTRFCKSIIRSRYALTYEQAQIRIDDPSSNDSVTLSLRSLNKLAKILKKRRIEKGALVLASPEVRFHVDSETHDPVEVVVKALRDTNSMVEEFMLLANISVATHLLEHFPACALLRRHPQPPKDNFAPLIKAARNRDLDIDIDTNKALAVSLDEAARKAKEEQDNPYLGTMLRILATRCMMQAVYFSSGMLQVEDYVHYGLAVPLYTHFTSPIRRYADVIVHRLLAASIGADVAHPDILDKRKSHNLCHNLNYRNRMAQYAGRASVALHTHLFFRERVQDEEGHILFVRRNALQVLIPKYGLEGTLYLGAAESKTGNPKKISTSDPSSIPAPVFTFNEEDQSQRCGSIVFRVFDPLTVQLSLDRSNVQHEKLVLKLVHPVIPGFSVPSSNQGVKRKEEESASEEMQVDSNEPARKKR
ncbi:exosome complex exonuclease RRP44 [Ischnura elegans]|uniref:exosome complex exonuclease RRP44 n=1 Tax=Ischnura elegans TaxID=197161 RepID=UPI001ED88B48|nr:exosome complex exonuclease RRP44 [Ischnura elegans]